jgi:hypothetical protein
MDNGDSIRLFVYFYFIMRFANSLDILLFQNFLMKYTSNSINTLIGN